MPKSGFWEHDVHVSANQQSPLAASRRHLRPGDLDEPQRQALREARVPEQFAHLDDLMND